MTARHRLLALLALFLLAPALLAERPAQPRDKADLIITGTIKKITPSERPYGGDGTLTSYVADVVIDAVERGKGARVGQTVKVGWYRVTKAPSKPLPGAYGHTYKIRAKDKARFWLMKNGKTWTVIYNSNGVEKLAK